MTAIASLPPLRVGIAIIEDTRVKLQLPKRLEEHNKDASIIFSVIDMERDLQEQGPFDVIIHKVLEWYNFGEDIGSEKLLKLSKLSLENESSIKFLDPIEETLKLADRCLAMDILVAASNFSVNGITVFVPPFTFIPEPVDTQNTTDHINTILSSKEIKFPIISKPPICRCDVEAHDMSIMFNRESLIDIKTPVVVQQFIDHGSLLYKVAVVGDSFYVCERPSVKNLAEVNFGSTSTIYFDSMTVSKSDRYCPELHDVNPLEQTYRTSVVKEEELPEKDRKGDLLDEAVVKELVRRIRQHVKLSLFGVDIIIDSKTHNYGLIDLNYLPSFKGILSQFSCDLYTMLKSHHQDLADELLDEASGSSLLDDSTNETETGFSTSSMSDWQESE